VPGYPEDLPFVTAVGGTSLVAASNARGWSETAWSYAGSGCSATEAKPKWQTDTGCPTRTIADVAAVADGSTGALAYDSFNDKGVKGWLLFGGTSMSSPIIASVYALAGNESSLNGASLAYRTTKSLNDVTSGSNGTCGTYMCNAGPGFDGPTGNGTPNGTKAF
jgi:subtilase family serine protease